MVLAGSFKLNAGVPAKGGQLRFKGVTGRVEVWIDGVLVTQRSEAATSPLVAPLTAGPRDRDVRVLLNGIAGERIGLPGNVFVEAGQ